MKRSTALLVVAGACLWMGLEYFALGPFSFADIYDSSDLTIPIRLAFGLDRSAPRSSLWMPWVGAGTDRLANEHLHLSMEHLYLVLPGWLAYQTFLLAQFAVCAYFTYRLARDRLGCDEAASVFAAVCALVYLKVQPTVETAFMPYARGGHALLPFLLWLFDGLRNRPGRPPWEWLVLLGLAHSTFSTVAVVLPFTAIVLAVWLTVARGDARIRTLGMLAVFCCASLVPHLKIVWALAANVPLSHRGAWPPMDPSWRTVWKETATGLLAMKMPVLLGCAGLAWGGRKDPLLRRLLAAVFLCIVLPGVASCGQSLLGGKLGFLKGFRFQRLFLVAPILAAAFAGRGLVFLQPRRWWLGGGAAVLLLISLHSKAYHAAEWVLRGSYAANFFSPVLRDLGSLREEPFRVASLPGGVHPGYALAYGLETADSYLSVFPRDYQLFWGKVVGPLAARDPELINGNFGRGGCQLYLFLRDSKPYARSGLPFPEFYNLDLLSLVNVKYLISRIPLRHQNLRPVRAPAPLPGDRWGRLKSRLVENFTGRTRLHVYENRTVLPRAFFPRRARFFPGRNALFDELARTDARTLRETAFLEEAASRAAGSGPFAEGKASFSAYLPDRLELAVEATGPSLLVVLNNFSPYWKCEVDGAPTELLKAYGTFWAVRLPAGARSVVFRYDPPYR